MVGSLTQRSDCGRRLLFFPWGRSSVAAVHGPFLCSYYALTGDAGPVRTPEKLPASSIETSGRTNWPIYDYALGGLVYLPSL